MPTGGAFLTVYLSVAKDIEEPGAIRAAVRIATTSDWTFVETMEENRGVTPSRLMHKLTEGDVFVAESDGKLVGYLRLDHLYSVVPYISLVWVVAEHRGKGIGSALLAFTEETLREQGHEILLSSTELDEAAPQEWHRKMGFRDCGVLFGLSPGRYGDLFFRKQIKNH
jgi:GNAT superfamily N-acetyltransferase